MKTKLIITALFCVGIAFGQNDKYNSLDISVSPFIDGTLMKPDISEKTPIVIIIADSGPTDRNGNQQMMKNNSLRFLAEELYTNNIASFRYDKRIIKQMKDRTLSEESIRFDEFITDAINVTDFFIKGGAFSKIYIIGHGQGSLVGMIAAKDRADGFISIAGVGQEIDDVIVAQLVEQAPGLEENARQAFDDLRVMGIAVNYSPGLASIFRKDIQPFMRSWMLFNPKEEIANLKIPILIINGDKNLEVQISESELLHHAQSNAQYEIIPKMNHILKKIEGDDLENSKSYNQYNLKVMPEVIEIISSFIKK